MRFRMTTIAAAAGLALAAAALPARAQTLSVIDDPDAPHYRTFIRGGCDGLRFVGVIFGEMTVNQTEKTFYITGVESDPKEPRRALIRGRVSPEAVNNVKQELAWAIARVNKACNHPMPLSKIITTDFVL